MMRFRLLLILCLFATPILAAEDDPVEGTELGGEAVFDDQALINGYTEKYAGENQDILMAMINDDSLGAYKTAAAIRVFKQRFAPEVLKDDKPNVVRSLMHRLNRTDSAFVQVEVMHTLVVLDRYQYFNTMVPTLIQKMDHYNQVVSALAYDNLLEIFKNNARSREARVVFNTLRKVFFLQRRRLAQVQNPDPTLRRKLDVLRWSVKVLGTQELKNLPQEIIGLL